MGNWSDGILLLIGGGLLFILFSRQQTIQLRINHLAQGEEFIPREILMRHSFFERAFGPFMRFLTKTGDNLTPKKQRIRIHTKLQEAGLNGHFKMQAILAAKGGSLVGVVLVVLLFFVFRLNPGLMLMSGACLWLGGMIGPEKWLEWQIEQRREAITRALPDTVDLVTSSVEAGLGFDSAIQRISECSGDTGRELKEELSRYLGDLRLGQSRQNALLALAERCNIDEMRGIVAALMQADEIGVGVATVLRAQSRYLRIRRRQRAQEAAMKSPIKMLFPLVFCIFPFVFIIIIGPAILRVIDSMPKF